MQRKFTASLSIFAAICALGAPAMASANIAIHDTINSVGIFGQDTGSSREGAAAGIGITAGATFGQFFTTSTLRYSLTGAPASRTGTAGNFWTLDVDGGYLFPLSSDFQVGPYIGFNRMAYQRTYGPQTLSASDNNLGGGIYAAWSPFRKMTFITHVGGYGAFAASAHIAGYPLQAYNSNLVQVGLKADYRISGPFHLFAGFQYDNYTGRYGTPLYNGSVGVAYTY